MSEAYVRGTIGAAFLAPNLVEQIVEGRQPAALGVDALKAMLPLPNDWDAQRAMFAALG